MHSSLFSNARCFKLEKLGPASLNNYELAERLRLSCRGRGKISGYNIQDAFFYDDDGNIAMIRISQDIVAVAHLYERVHSVLQDELAAVLLSRDGSQVALEEALL